MLLSVIAYAQKNLPQESSLGPTIRIETGTYVPLQTFKKAINISPYLGIIGGIKLNDKLRLDPKLVFFLPQSKDPVKIIGNDSIVTGRINLLSGHFGASINRVEKLGARTFVEARLGSGFSFLQTDAKEFDSKKNSEDTHYGSETIFLNAGLGIKVFAFKQSYIGLEFNYYFTPYNLFGKRFDGSIGNQALSFGLSYGL